MFCTCSLHWIVCLSKNMMMPSPIRFLRGIFDFHALLLILKLKSKFHIIRSIYSKRWLWSPSAWLHPDFYNFCIPITVLDCGLLLVLHANFWLVCLLSWVGSLLSAGRLRARRRNWFRVIIMTTKKTSQNFLFFPYFHDITLSCKM